MFVYWYIFFIFVFYYFTLVYCIVFMYLVVFSKLSAITFDQTHITYLLTISNGWTKCLKKSYNFTLNETSELQPEKICFCHYYLCRARERRRCGGSRVPLLSFIYESLCKMLYAHLTKHKRAIELLCRCSEMIDFIALQCAKKSFKTGKIPYNRSQNCTYLTFECSKRIED